MHATAAFDCCGVTDGRHNGGAHFCHEISSKGLKKDAEDMAEEIMVKISHKNARRFRELDVNSG